MANCRRLSANVVSKGIEPLLPHQQPKHKNMGHQEERDPKDRDEIPRAQRPRRTAAAWAKRIKPALARVGDDQAGTSIEPNGAGRGADPLVMTRQLRRSRYCFTKSQPTSAM